MLTAPEPMLLSALNETPHPWPSTEASWTSLVKCTSCGLQLLDLLVSMQEWVTRRVERATFIDDRTLRRCVSVDYFSQAAPVFLEGMQLTRVFPIALMRRKSLVSFDLRTSEGHSTGLIGLRENQALTLSMLRGWAGAVLLEWSPELVQQGADGSIELPDPVEEFLFSSVLGDQRELDEGFKDMWDAEPDSPLKYLGQCRLFRDILNRLVESFILFATEPADVTGRRLIKYSYDEPLTFHHRKAGYHREPPPATSRDPEPDGSVSRYEDMPRMRWWEARPFLAGMGFKTTVVRFPVPAAELASSFHFEITVPTDVSIVTAAVIAGRPNVPRPATEEAASEQPKDPHAERLAKVRRRTRPSFDFIEGGRPTVDLHVSEVPFGSLSRAQVELQASPKGWLFTAVTTCVLTAVSLWVPAAQAKHIKSDIAATLLVTFAAGVVAALVRPDSHRLVTRLLTSVRNLAGGSAVLAFLAALVFTFSDAAEHQDLLFALAGLSCIPAGLVTASWICHRLRPGRRSRELSPWEQRRPRSKSRASEREPLHVTLARELEGAKHGYDKAIDRLGFSEPAIRVASSEGTFPRFFWDSEFEKQFKAAIGRGKSLASHPGRRPWVSSNH